MGQGGDFNAALSGCAEKIRMDARYPYRGKSAASFRAMRSPPPSSSQTHRLRAGYEANRPPLHLLCLTASALN